MLVTIIFRHTFNPLGLFASETNDNVIKPAAAFDDDEVEAKSKRPALSFVPPSASEKTTTSRSNSSNYPDLKAVANLSIAEKKAIIKQIIERIPTNMEELFTYPIDWRAVDAVSARLLSCFVV